MITNEDVIQMARECGIDVSLNKSSEVWDVDLETFAALVAAHERESCAKVCDEYANKCVEAENWEAEDVSLHCAAAIRARGEK